MWSRLYALVIKELLAIWRDKRSRFVLIGPPIVQLFLFSYAATLEVTNVNIGVIDRDAGRWSAEFVQRVDGASAFGQIRRLANLKSAREAIDNQDVLAVLHFDETFSRDINAGRPAQVQLLLDGRRSNAAQITTGYLSEITADLTATSPVALETEPARNPAAADPVVVRHWFNPNLKDFWFIVPGLLGTLTLLIVLVVTGQTIARERELGTFDQIMVSPLRVHEILLGKTVPAMIAGLAQATAFIAFAVFFFEVPFRGSLALLYLGTFVYLLAVIGVGLFISSLSQTQQQAFLGAFLFAAPAILLSGFATPIENMPDWLQHFTQINPLRHFLVIVRGVFLRAMPAEDVLANTVPLALIAAFTLTVAGWLFRARMG